MQSKYKFTFSTLCVPQVLLLERHRAAAPTSKLHACVFRNFEAFESQQGISEAACWSVFHIDDCMTMSVQASSALLDGEIRNKTGETMQTSKLCAGLGRLRNQCIADPHYRHTGEQQPLHWAYILDPMYMAQDCAHMQSKCMFKSGCILALYVHMIMRVEGIHSLRTAVVLQLRGIIPSLLAS